RMTGQTTAGRESDRQRGRHRAVKPERVGAFTGRRDTMITRSLMSTIPVLVAGTMTMGMALTGPIAPASPTKSAKPKDATANLREAIREAMKRQAATARVDAQQAAEAVVSVASVPSTYRVKAGDTVSAIAARFGLSTAKVLAL